MSPAEQRAADEAIAGGGGAVAGHIVTGDLCAAAQSYWSLGGDQEVSAVPHEQRVAALEALAGIESPYQDRYAAYLATVLDVEGSSLEAEQTVAAEFADALQVDIATCS